ncbi:MAG: hypothetical protein MJZ21_04300, partial [archaeon]|nr:hypothetical protein [archaeon]
VMQRLAYLDDDRRHVEQMTERLLSRSIPSRKRTVRYVQISEIGMPSPITSKTPTKVRADSTITASFRNVPRLIASLPPCAVGGVIHNQLFVTNITVFQNQLKKLEFTRGLDAFIASSGSSAQPVSADPGKITIRGSSANATITLFVDKKAFCKVKREEIVVLDIQPGKHVLWARSGFEGAEKMEMDISEGDRL